MLEELRSMFSYLLIVLVIMPLTIAYIRMCNKEDSYYEDKKKNSDNENNKLEN